MTDIEKDIEKINDTLKLALETTPKFLNGLLIPASRVDGFYYSLTHVIKRSRDAEKYWEQIIQATVDSEKARNDFVKALCDGKIKFTKEEYFDRNKR